MGISIAAENTAESSTFENVPVTPKYLKSMSKEDTSDDKQHPNGHCITATNGDSQSKIPICENSKLINPLSKNKLGKYTELIESASSDSDYPANYEYMNGGATNSQNNSDLLLEKSDDVSDDDKSLFGNGKDVDSGDQKWYRMLLEVGPPFLLAGIGMVMAGLLLDKVQVF